MLRCTKGVCSLTRMKKVRGAASCHCCCCCLCCCAQSSENLLTNFLQLRCTKGLKNTDALVLSGKKASVPLDDALRLLRTPQVPRLVDANTALDLLRGPAALGTATSSGPGQLKIGERLWCLVSGDAAPWFQDMLASLPASHEKGMSCSITATAYLTFQRQMLIAPHSDTECSKKMRMECLNVRKAFATGCGKMQQPTTASVFVQFCTKHTLKTAACATHTVPINNPNTHQPSLSANSQSQLGATCH